ncbi:MAG: transcription-repair coupling factor [Planctomycetes bacterium]|nr:transcription-repair coupling factor [Planctomycetota bacterium]
MDAVNGFDAIRSDPRLTELVRLLAAHTGPVAAGGLWGSCAPILAALVSERMRRPLLLVSAHADEADDCRDDWEAASGRVPELFPQLENLPGEAISNDELEGERLRLCLALLERSSNGTPSSTPAATPPAEATAAQPLGLVASVQALMQPVPSPGAIAAQSITIDVGLTLEPQRLLRWLAERGFKLCDQVELPGDYAYRGGIVDVFSNAHTDAIRIEFFGDEVDSMRLFDAGTQRSSHKLQSIRIPALSMSSGRSAAAAGHAGAETTSFLALLPPDTVIAFNEPGEIQELGRTYWQRLGEPAGLIPVEALFRRANDFTQLHLQRFAGGIEAGVDFAVGSLPQFEPKAAEALQALGELARECHVIVFCDNRPEEQRFQELLTQPPEAEPLPRNVRERISTTVSVVHRGFRWQNPAEPSATAYAPHHELFQRYRQRRTLRRVQPARPIDSFFDLKVGDHVVHALHGIGRFLGLKTLERVGRRDEYLAIEYANKAIVHVAVSQIHLVQKYIGGFRGKPKLSKLGGTAWKRTKQRVAEAVTDMAAELLAIQAERAARPGIAYPHDTTWQREFEGSFLYTETEDQAATLEQIKLDMHRARPMDRLLCGDVGYGKTELAIRAAFKTVEYGKQVAVLVPTTVLAEQHFQTFTERLADYPFVIDVLSRFRTQAEQRRIVERARKGQIDVLIGTHRLLSGDVRFADLGLVVIDEEQRFGVEAKERLKRLRATVDVLTLSATPIPRTLHMAMLGIRDISSLATPPLDRRAIVTQVCLWDDRLVRDAIVREMNRDGQVFFVHNFVRDIHSVANRVRGIVPEARVVVGHGQMKGSELEQVMLRFVAHDADVLVSTNIIESGLDIPAANTIFINRAERFGLADLHQLRGRVGRSKHRAYAYLLLSPKHPVKDVAARRLKAIEHYSELGAGFQIAMRDLEIRGAGNILGSEQSGHIEAVGYEMYCQLLEQAARRLRDEPAEPWRPVNLELGVAATIPRGYIPSERQRMDVYKRLAHCRTPDDIATLHDDVLDAFGPLPEAVQTLLTLAEIRVLAQPWGIRSLVLVPPDVVFAIDNLQRARPLFESGPGSPRVPDPKTVHWRLPKRYLELPTLLTTLRRQLAGAEAPVPQQQPVGS